GRSTFPRQGLVLLNRARSARTVVLSWISAQCELPSEKEQRAREGGRLTRRDPPHLDLQNIGTREDDRLVAALGTNARSIDLDDPEALLPSRVRAHRDTLTFLQLVD